MTRGKSESLITPQSAVLLLLEGLLFTQNFMGCRMFPNPIMAVGLAIFLYFFLIGIHFISVAGILGFPTIIVAILTLFLCVIIKITNTQFKNMKSILDELFRYYQI